mmetsp:Transcript_35362/g.44665  ORF Transcript_35362/g.44665 Transcript_35362/m.44665 type:complete len:102 (-) Transcript_35362:8-313(-)
MLLPLEFQLCKMIWLKEQLLLGITSSQAPHRHVQDKKQQPDQSYCHKQDICGNETGREISKLVNYSSTRVCHHEKSCKAADRSPVKNPLQQTRSIDLQSLQ